MAYVGGLALSIPAIASIVSHFVGHVLAETQLGRVDANFQKEELNARHKIAQRLIVDHSL